MQNGGCIRTYILELPLTPLNLHYIYGPVRRSKVEGGSGSEAVYHAVRDEVTYVHCKCLPLAMQ